jgi:hypothetical protein
VNPISFPDKDPAFEGDLLRMGLGVKVRNNTTAFFLNYGLTDTLDVGVAVPFVQVHLEATIDANIQRLSTTDPRIHTFVANQDVSYERFSDSGTATGLGDISLRGKWNCLKRAGGGLALAFDLRLPTGNEDDLLGTGATQFRPMAIYSGEFGRLAPRASVGYTFSHGTISDAASFQVAESGLGQAVFQGQTPATAAALEVPDEINYTAGLSVAAHPRVTVGLDLLGRSIRDRNRFGTTTQTFPYRTQNASAGGQIQNAQRTDVTATTGQGTLTSLIGAAGLKWNLWGTLLLNANVLFPINDSGLRIEITPALGLDYSF